MTDIAPASTPYRRGETGRAEAPATVPPPGATRVTTGTGTQRAEGPPRRFTRYSRRKVIAVVVVVVVLLGYFAKERLFRPHYGPGAKVPAGQIVQLGTDTITANLADGHLAQIGISLQLTAPANTREVNADTPELLGSTVQILGEQTYTGLLDPSGRRALAQNLLHSYQRDLGTSEGAVQVSAVYLTSFVLQ